ncbi:MAG: 2-hydroxyglutaryl-CoA dehydratase [Candidatus Omnitrophica bacterium]|nr:2-hydroxyglutaryl-CoA dehydratase [Candidatus Omnitrophota bacterium]
MIFAGLDIGSVSTETVIIDEHKRVLSYVILRTSSNNKKTAEESVHLALRKVSMTFKDVSNIVSTGYGRKIIPFKADEISEISCHARGAHFLYPDTKIVIDIGGQDSKAIRIVENGQAIDFNMNDKCAAGTGRFLEEMAKALDVTVEELGCLSLKSEKELSISSMCTVFAESEVVSLLAEGRAREDIAKALHNAIAERVASLANRVLLRGVITLTGGVAKNIGVVEALKSKFSGMIVNIPEEPQMVGALGAALIALNSMDNLNV